MALLARPTWVLLAPDLHRPVVDLDVVVRAGLARPLRDTATAGWVARLHIGRAHVGLLEYPHNSPGILEGVVELPLVHGAQVVAGDVVDRRTHDVGVLLHLRELVLGHEPVGDRLVRGRIELHAVDGLVGERTGG